MGAIVEFPLDQNDRLKKINEIKERKRKQTSPKKSSEPSPKPVKPVPVKQAPVINIEVPGVSALTKTIDDTNDIAKCITDCLYDLSWSITNFKKLIMIISLVFGVAMGAVLLTLVLMR